MSFRARARLARRMVTVAIAFMRHSEYGEFLRIARVRAGMGFRQFRTFAAHALTH